MLVLIGDIIIYLRFLGDIGKLGGKRLFIDCAQRITDDRFGYITTPKIGEHRLNVIQHVHHSADTMRAFSKQIIDNALIELPTTPA